MQVPYYRGGGKGLLKGHGICGNGGENIGRVCTGGGIVSHGYGGG